MQITGFKDYERVGTDYLDTIEYATITVKTGWLSNAETERPVFKPAYSTYWKFLSTGETVPIPGFAIEQFVNSYIAKRKHEKHLISIGIEPQASNDLS